MEHQAEQIIIECKSLPRSGFHFLKNTLQSYLGENFSSCERYDEPGCCNKMTCSLSELFINDAKQHRVPHLRLLKSHDSTLNDPIFPSSYNRRHLILQRDPLFCLTSVWELYLVKLHTEILAQFDVNYSKIGYLHERPVFNYAIQLLDEHYDATHEAIFNNWLDEYTTYMVGFIQKWMVNNKDEYADIVDYDDLAQYAFNLACDIVPSGVTLKQIDKGENKFIPRQDPFKVKSQRISEFLLQNRNTILQMMARKGLIAI